jgi:hypothetical protein
LIFNERFFVWLQLVFEKHLTCIGIVKEIADGVMLGRQGRFESLDSLFELEQFGANVHLVRLELKVAHIPSQSFADATGEDVRSSSVKEQIAVEVARTASF